MYEQQLQVTDKSKYLGSILSQKGKIDEEITNQIQIEGNFFSAIKSVVWNKSVPRNFQRENMSKTNFIPILT